MTNTDPIDVLYRDGLMLVVNKPAGISVHSGPSGGPSLEDCFDALRYGLPRSPALAHRLDRDTSGCLVLGRHPKALRRLGKLFTEGRVRKTYWALVRGAPEKQSGTWDAPLIKTSSQKGGWRMVVDDAGQTAKTAYRTLGRSDQGLTWLELRPKTGRTHQIRVHCQQAGCPIFGDPWYGSDQDRVSAAQLHLHARAISLPLYPNKEAVQVIAPLPDAMKVHFSACGYDSESEA